MKIPKIEKSLGELTLAELISALSLVMASQELQLKFIWLQDIAEKLAAGKEVSAERQNKAARAIKMLAAK